MNIKQCLIYVLLSSVSLVANATQCEQNCTCLHQTIDLQVVNNSGSSISLSHTDGSSSGSTVSFSGGNTTISSSDTGSFPIATTTVMAEGLVQWMDTINDSSGNKICDLSVASLWKVGVNGYYLLASVANKDGSNSARCKLNCLATSCTGKGPGSSATPCLGWSSKAPTVKFMVVVKE